MYYHGSYNFRPTKFKDFSTGHFKGKSQFSRTKINSINRHSLTLFQLAKTLNGDDYDFYFFSYTFDHVILY